MEVVYAFFAARRYWPQEEALQAVYGRLAARTGAPERCRLIVDGAGLDALPAGGCLVAAPLSGAVQRQVLAAAEGRGAVVLYAAYVQGNAEGPDCSAMLRANAAPTVMDAWAVLRRRGPEVMLAASEGQLSACLRLARAAGAVRGARLLAIGPAEPWVISPPADTETYKRLLGVEVAAVPQRELAALYESAGRAQAAPYRDWFAARCAMGREPGEEDVWNGARMAWALETLLARYAADGAAIACFALLRLGATACLGVSYVNGCTRRVAACEGDLDSAVTMLALKQLTDTRPWMANPALQPDGTVHFSHCTAPVCPAGEDLPCTLRSHHESGIGAALEVALPAGMTVTACRIGAATGQMTVHRGVIQAGPPLPACRTQAYVRFDDPARYLATCLGCHQVFAFADIAGEARALGGLLGLAVV